MSAAGIDGFLGTRASLMLDLVVVAMAVVLPVLGASIALVKYRRRYELHKRIQLVLGAVLLVTVLAFEADMRINGWRERAVSSRFWGSAPSDEPAAPTDAATTPTDRTAGTTNWVDRALAVHIFFAATTTLLWAVVIARALKHFPHPPAPCAHSTWHRRWGKLAAIDMLMTALTGWLFYWMAFVA
jgi:putative membrane protein